MQHYYAIAHIILFEVKIVFQQTYFVFLFSTIAVDGHDLFGKLQLVQLRVVAV